MGHIFPCFFLLVHKTRVCYYCAISCNVMGSQGKGPFGTFSQDLEILRKWSGLVLP